MVQININKNVLYGIVIIFLLYGAYQLRPRPDFEISFTYYQDSGDIELVVRNNLDFIQRAYFFWEGAREGTNYVTNWVDGDVYYSRVHSDYVFSSEVEQYVRIAGISDGGSFDETFYVQVKVKRG